MYKLTLNEKVIITGSYYDCYYKAQDMKLDMFVIESIHNKRTVRI